MEELLAVDNKDTSILAKIRRFGGHMSGMVMPNLGAFVGWGLMAALFIENGWLPNATLAQLVGPIMQYVFPLLIGYTAGYNIHGQRGGVIGLFSTMGVVVGADITMISGAMIMGPLSAWILKKIDDNFKEKIPAGFEMLYDNFSIGVLAAILCIFGFLAIGPVVRGLIGILTAGVAWATENRVIPLLSVFMAPAQVLFLNNVVNHGILAPIGYAQAAETGKSIMFLIDTNNGPLLGTLFSFAIFGKGKWKETAPMAMFIAGIAGIGEVYFPFVLGNPVMLLATMGGLAVSLFLLVILNGGLIGVASPGSLINIFLMTPRDSILANGISIAVGFIVSFLIGAFLLKRFVIQKDEEALENIKESPLTSKKDVKNKELTTNLYGENSLVNKEVRKIVVACDSGMGSSAFGATTLKGLLNKEGFNNIKVVNSSANNIAEDADIVVTLESLIERAKINNKNEETMYIPVNNFLREDDYEEVIKIIKEKTDTKTTSNRKTEQESEFNLSYLSDNNIRLNKSYKKKSEAIIETGKILVDNGYVTPDYIDEMIERENNVSTYIGNNVAIPHGLESSRDKILNNGISLIQIPEGIDYGDGNVVKLIIGIAGKNNTHLDIIQQLAIVLKDQEKVDRIVSANTVEEIKNIFR